jgi:hypothetical protein
MSTALRNGRRSPKALLRARLRSAVRAQPPCSEAVKIQAQAGVMRRARSRVERGPFHPGRREASDGPAVRGRDRAPFRLRAGLA